MNYRTSKRDRKIILIAFVMVISIILLLAFGTDINLKNLRDWRIVTLLVLALMYVMVITAFLFILNIKRRNAKSNKNLKTLEKSILIPTVTVPKQNINSVDVDPPMKNGNGSMKEEGLPQ